MASAGRGGTPDEPVFAEGDLPVSILAAARGEGARWRRLCLAGAGDEGLSFEEVEQVAACCPGLTHLSLAFFRPRGALQGDDSFLSARLEPPRLVHLNLSDIRVAGGTLRSLVRACAPTLERLYLSGTWVIREEEEEGAEDGAEAEDDDEDEEEDEFGEDIVCPRSPLSFLRGIPLPALVSLDLSYCLVREAPLCRLLEAAPALSELFLVGALQTKGSPAWAEADLPPVKEARPGLEPVLGDFVAEVRPMLKGAADDPPAPSPALLAQLPAVRRGSGPDVPLASGASLFLHAVGAGKLRTARAMAEALGCDPLAPALPSWLRGRRQRLPWAAPYPMRPEAIDRAAGLLEADLPGRFASNRVCDQDPAGAGALHFLASRLLYDSDLPLADARAFVEGLGLARLVKAPPAPGPGGLSPLGCALHALALEPALVEERLPYLLSLGLRLDPPDDLLAWALARGGAHLPPTLLRALAHDPAALARALRFKDAAGNTPLALAVARMGDRASETPALGITWLAALRALLAAGGGPPEAPLLPRACAARPELKDEITALFAEHGGPRA